MKVIYRGLNMFFDGKLPSPEKVADALTFHAWEIDGIEEKEGTEVLDVKVLPDKTPWAFSHRGIAKDLSVVLNMPLALDPFHEKPVLLPKTDVIEVNVETPKCRRYIAAYVKGVKIQPSPEWMQENLRALGQRPINNIVDMTNCVMFGIGQPLHAFDAKKLSKLAVGVRMAEEGEKITVLTGEEFTLGKEDMVIVDGGNNAPIGIAGVKGGKAASIDEGTTDIIIESANFDPISVRKTSQRLRLRTDASARFENGVVPDVASYGMRDVIKFITDFAELGGGEVVGFVDTGEEMPPHPRVLLTLKKLNSVLGLSLTKEEVDGVIARFGYEYSWQKDDNGDTLLVQPPFERPDLVIPEDLIEEIGRIYGYDHVTSVTPTPVAVSEINKTFYYIDSIRAALQDAGFSEVFTSSFRAKDEVKLANAFASDKGYLRSELTSSMDGALTRNAPNADLLGAREIRTFEVGTVFTKENELTQTLALSLGVRSPSGYKTKHDDPILEEGIVAVEKMLGVTLSWNKKGGITEATLSDVLAKLPTPSAYVPFEKTPDITYKPFSSYPFASRDVAFWFSLETASLTRQAPEEYWRELIVKSAGPLLKRLDLFDQFEKDGKTSYAFRLIFQSYEKTLTEEEINSAMEAVYSALKVAGCEIR